MIYGESPTYGWVGELVDEWVLSCQMTNNKINLYLIETIDSVWRFMIYGDFATHTPTHPIESVISNWNFESSP